MSTAAKVMALADAHITERWGPRGEKKGGRNPAYGLDYWAHYDLVRDGGAPAPKSWRSTIFEWGLVGDQDREEPRNAYVFFAGATFWASRDNPATADGNLDWLAARR